MAYDEAVAGSTDPVRSTATSAAEGRLKTSLMTRKRNKIGSGAVSGSVSNPMETTIPVRRNINRILDEKKGVGI